jgi:hypothetical protein
MERAKEGECFMYFSDVHENRIMKPVANVLR